MDKSHANTRLTKSKQENTGSNKLRKVRGEVAASTGGELFVKLILLQDRSNLTATTADVDLSFNIRI